jgi:hypothetical protein
LNPDHLAQHGNPNPLGRPDLFICACAILYTFHQSFEVRRIALTPDLHANQVLIGIVFVTVNRVFHFAQVSSQLNFLLLTTASRATGSAAEAKMIRIERAMINSSRVVPASEVRRDILRWFRFL